MLANVCCRGSRLICDAFMAGICGYIWIMTCPVKDITGTPS